MVNNVVVIMVIIMVGDGEQCGGNDGDNYGW